MNRILVENTLMHVHTYHVSGNVADGQIYRIYSNRALPFGTSQSVSERDQELLRRLYAISSVDSIGFEPMKLEVEKGHVFAWSEVDQYVIHTIILHMGWMDQPVRLMDQQGQHHDFVPRHSDAESVLQIPQLEQ